MRQWAGTKGSSPSLLVQKLLLLALKPCSLQTTLHNARVTVTKTQQTSKMSRGRQARYGTGKKGLWAHFNKEEAGSPTIGHGCTHHTTPHARNPLHYLLLQLLFNLGLCPLLNVLCSLVLSLILALLHRRLPVSPAQQQEEENAGQTTELHRGWGGDLQSTRRMCATSGGQDGQRE